MKGGGWGDSWEHWYTVLTEGILFKCLVLLHNYYLFLVTFNDKGYLFKVLFLILFSQISVYEHPSYCKKNVRLDYAWQVNIMQLFPLRHFPKQSHQKRHFPLWEKFLVRMRWKFFDEDLKVFIVRYRLECLSWYSFSCEKFKSNFNLIQFHILINFGKFFVFALH